MLFYIGPEFIEFLQSLMGDKHSTNISAPYTPDQEHGGTTLENCRVKPVKETEHGLDVSGRAPAKGLRD